MKIQRQEFLDNLQMVKAGLSPREFIEQSASFVFQDGEVMTFNDEIACRKEIGFNLTGAVQADLMMAILEKMDDEQLSLSENERGQFEFRGKSKRFWLTRDAEIFLPIDKVEKVKEWEKLPKGFADAVKFVRHCVSSDETKFFLTCVHIRPDYIESCDNRQLTRYRIALPGVEESLLIRGAALIQITDLGMSHMSITRSWVHFKNRNGLMFSCRKYMEEYPSLGRILKFEGQPIIIPRGLLEAKERAVLFAADQSEDPLLTVQLRPGKMMLTGEGISGGYEERKKLKYDGPGLHFKIPPDVLQHISEHYTEAEISIEKLRAVQKGVWVYITVLGRIDEKKEPAEEEEAE